MYRYNEKGEIVKKNDHLMDAMRYGIRTGKLWAIVGPSDDDVGDSRSGLWDSRDAITGY